jgi:plastocyanin
MRSILKFALPATAIISAAAFAVWFGLVDSTLAAEGSGSIVGTIVFEGQAPKMPPIQMAANPECETVHTEPVLRQMLVLDDEQHIANILVSVVAGLPEGVEYPVPEEPVVMSQEGCMYTPRVFGIRAGQELTFTNPDKFLHNVHALPKVNSEFNRSMNSQRTEITTAFKKPEPVFDIKCDVHSWMQSFCTVFNHPFFAVTAPDGTFTIEGLPAGEYEIEAWHERLPTQRATVTVEASGKTVADFMFKRPGT